MPSLNKVMLIGHVGRDPEVKYLANGDAVANVTLATTETWKDKSTGEKQEKTEWHRLVFFRRLAEIVSEYVTKGMPIYIEGRLQTRSYEKEGVKHYSTEIVCDQMQMLGRKSDNTSSDDSRDHEERPRSKPAAKPAQQDFDEDVPF